MSRRSQRLHHEDFSQFNSPPDVSTSKGRARTPATTKKNSISSTVTSTIHTPGTREVASKTPGTAGRRRAASNSPTTPEDTQDEVSSVGSSVGPDIGAGTALLASRTPAAKQASGALLPVSPHILFEEHLAITPPPLWKRLSTRFVRAVWRSLHSIRSRSWLLWVLTAIALAAFALGPRHVHSFATVLTPQFSVQRWQQWRAYLQSGQLQPMDVDFASPSAISDVQIYLNNVQLGVSRLQKEVVDVRAAVDQVSSSHHSLTQQVASVDNSCQDSLQNALKGIHATIEELQAHLSAVTSEQRSQQETIQALQTSAVDFSGATENALQELREQINSVTSSLEQTTATLAGLQRDVSTLDAARLQDLQDIAQMTEQRQQTPSADHISTSNSVVSIVSSALAVKSLVELQTMLQVPVDPALSQLSEHFSRYITAHIQPPIEDPMVHVQAVREMGDDMTLTNHALHALYRAWGILPSQNSAVTDAVSSWEKRLTALDYITQFSSAIALQNLSIQPYDTILHRAAELRPLVRVVDGSRAVEGYFADIVNQPEDKLATIKEVAGAINAALAAYDADKIGLTDYALASSGACVDTEDSRTSKTWGHAAATRVTAEDEAGLARIAASYGMTPEAFTGTLSQTPFTALEPSLSPGRCWPMEGSRGVLTVKLARPVLITAVTLDHVAASLSPQRSRDQVRSQQGDQAPSLLRASAPHQFSVAVGSLTSDGRLITRSVGSFEYAADGPVTQTFAVHDSTERMVTHVQLVVESNYGNPDMTCIYRFRVHGRT